MEVIEAIVFEPVGCLAEFPAGPFLELAFHLFGRKWKASPSGSRAYWRLLNLMQSAHEKLGEPEKKLIETFEMNAVAGANVYEDVVPALFELNAMGIKLLLASSLCAAATAEFLDRHALNKFFSGVWSSDNTRGVKAVPVKAAIAGASLDPKHAMFLADTLEGLKMAQSLEVHSVLMMNDPDESMRLAMHNPSGGIVSLHELPDFLRLVAAEHFIPQAASKSLSRGPGGT